MAVVRNIVVRVGADIRDVQKQMKLAQKSIKQSTTSMGNSGTSMALTIGKSTALAAAAIVAAAVAAAAAIAAIVKPALDAYSEYSSASMGFKSLLDAQGRDFDNANKFIQGYTKDGLIPATNAMQSYKMLLARGYNDKQIQDIMSRLKDSAAFNRQSSLSMGEAIQSASEGLKNENSILVDNAGVTKNVSMMWADYAHQLGKGENSLTLAEKRQAEYNGIMQETKFQVGDSTKYAGTYAGQMQSLSKAFYDAQVAIGSAFAPVVQSVIPLLIDFANKITNVFNVVAQFTRALFKTNDSQTKNATTAKKAEKAETGLGNAIKATGEKAKQSVASFDELTQLQENMATGATNTTDNLSNPTVSAPNLNDAIPPNIQKAADVFKLSMQVVKDGLKLVWDIMTFNWVGAWNDIKKIMDETGLTEKWEKIKIDLSNKWSEIKTEASQKWTEIKTGISNKVDEIKSGAYEKWNTMASDATTKWSEVKTNISNKLTEIKTSISEKLEPIKSTISQKWDEVKTDVSTKWTSIKTSISDRISEIKTNIQNSDMYKKITDKFEETKNSIVDIWGKLKIKTSDVWGNIWDVIKGSINNVIDLINKFTSKANAIKFTTPNWAWLGDAANKSIGVNIKPMDHLATGGVTTGSAIVEIGEGKYNEAVIPLGNSPQFAEMKSDIVDSLVSKLGNINSGAKVLHATFQFGTTKVGKAIIDLINDTQSAYGTTLLEV